MDKKFDLIKPNFIEKTDKTTGVVMMMLVQFNVASKTAALLL